MHSDKNSREKILHEIESLPENEQQTILGIVENYIHSQADETKWNLLPQSWRLRITQSLNQADTGQLILNEDVVAFIRKKYGLNG